MISKRKFWKECMAVGLSLAMLVSGMPEGAAGSVTASAAEAEQSVVNDTSEPLPFYDLSAQELIADMGAGWNLGNTFDGHSNMDPNETAWQSDITTLKAIKGVHDAGFNSVRIPVTWGNMIKEETVGGQKVYSIDDAWISRVQDVVDYAISEGMYVVLNMHHDGAASDYYQGWFQIGSDDFESIRAKFSGMWKAIAEYFKNYDQHLIFESMNEITHIGDISDEEEIKRINTVNQDFVNVVRATGGCNAHRWLAMPGHYANIDRITDPDGGFELPDDPSYDADHNHLIIAVHEYPKVTYMREESTAKKGMATYVEEFKKLYETFTAKGIPVILGEYGSGCSVKDTMTEAEVKDCEARRAYLDECMTQLAKTAGAAAFVWDNNNHSTSGERYDFFDRVNGVADHPLLVEGTLRGTFSNQTEFDLSNVIFSTGDTVDTDYTRATAVTPEKSEVNLKMGETYTTKVSVTPSEASQDMMVWSSDDTSVATVYNGKITATGIGSTTVHVKSYLGTAKADVKVTVSAADGTACESITAPDSVTVNVEGYTRLNAVNATEGSDAFLTYKSSDTNIATVNKTGKIVGIASGTAEITITASTGFTKKVAVQVGSAEVKQGANLALYVLFNNKNYYNKEHGTPVFVNDDGQYTVTFDCNSDLSKDAQAISGLNLSDAGSIYIYDVDKATVFKQCNIKYDKVLVDGVEFAVTQQEAKSAITRNGMVDTGDPINIWDGSVVDGVSVVSNSHLSFANISKPMKIEVTFTLSDMWFKGADMSVADTKKQNAVEPTVAPTQIPTASAIVPTEPAVSADVQKGDVKTISGAKYTVTNVDKKTVEYKKSKKNTKSVSIPNTVKITVNGEKETFQVTGIAKNAFKNNKKLTTIKLGSNIKTIGANAFSGCSKLKSITVSSKKLTSVGKNAFQGIHKKAVFKVPAKVKKKYKKLINAKTGYRKTMKVK